MARMIILNGPAAAGKTTISQKLAKYDENSVVVHSDDIKNFIKSKSNHSLEEKLGYKHGAWLSSS